MNIVVCVKYVPDSTADRHFEEDYTVDRVGVDGLLSELDEYAVEQALQIKEKRPDEEVTVTANASGVFATCSATRSPGRTPSARSAAALTPRSTFRR